MSARFPPVNCMYFPGIIFLLIYLFIYFWLCWVFVAKHWLFLVAASGGCSSLRYMGFSLQWLLLLRSLGSRRAGVSSCGAQASVVVAHGLQLFVACGLSSCGLQALERRLSSCGARA